ncbi:MAG: nucleotide exchange factor GrpE [Pseudomonadota bacterium]|nr:nucleotide exchange factor GrpE [Pseudomonadota bacterium]
MNQDKKTPEAPDTVPIGTIDATPDETIDEAEDDTVVEAFAAGDAAEESTEDEVERLANEVAELNDKLLRAVAETENLRRRTTREREETGKYAVTGFARDLLSVADNLRRALDSLSDEIRGDEALGGLISGVEMTERELLNAFERHGIKCIDPEGEKFDHNFHQAMFEVADSDQPAGTVISVMQPGYVIAERLLRPAMVGIAKGGNDDSGGGDNNDAAPHIDTEA